MSGIRVVPAIGLALLVAACAAETRHKVLSVFFNGVPPPGERTSGKREPASAGAPAQAEPPIRREPPAVEPRGKPEPPLLEPTPPPRPAIESLGSWAEVLGALPRDRAGGIDWVRAIAEKVISPRALPGARKAPEPPFTLDTIVQGIGSGQKPPLDFDVEIVPEGAPFFKALFPHSSHTLWLNCSSCHPGIAAKRAPMEKILGGSYCGECHGRVAFDPATGGCPRCHTNLVPAAEEAIESDLRRAQEAAVPADPGLLALGAEVYGGNCAVCHGEEGDGKGPLAPFFDPRPRDFTQGRYKFRSTPSTSVPTDLDLFRVITLGVEGTSMPSWSRLAYEDRWALVHYLKTFSKRFPAEAPAAPISVPARPPRTPEALEEGKTLYTAAGCNACHGDGGAGDGESARDLVDDWGEPTRPFSFAGGRSPKRGAAPEDYYRTIMTGLAGTPMPDYGEIFQPEQAWALVEYLLTLGEGKKGAAFGLRGEIRFGREAADGDVPAATFPHWFHRIRFKCSACHPGVFEMKAGANLVDMESITAGRFCGACHDGKTAWEVGFETCIRCHAAE